MASKSIMYKIDLGIEEFILIFIILTQLLGFFNVIPPDLDYLNKIVSWTAMGYLMYKASLTEIFFATRHKTIDIILILAYFSMIIKNFVGYALSAIEGGASSFLISWFEFVLDNASTIEKWGFYVGGITILVLTLYISFTFYIRKPSIMEVIHGEGPPPKNPFKMFARMSMVFIILSAFFVIVFNLMMEWLAIALDAPILVLGIFLYLFFFMKHSKKFDKSTLIFKLGDFGEDFYRSFISLFHSKATLFLGISGMLVLHSLTEIGNFIIPYITGLHNDLYFVQFGAGHTDLLQMASEELLMMQSLIDKLVLAASYFFNVLAILFLLIIPSIVWYILYKRRSFLLPNWVTALFYASLPCFILAPAFRLADISAKNLMGVDIMTQSVLNADRYSLVNFFLRNLALPLWLIAIASVGVFLLVWALCQRQKIQQFFQILAVLIGQGFFGVYVYYFFRNVAQYYMISITSLMGASHYLITFYFCVFLVITILFYIGGYFVFLYETWKS